MTQYRAARIIFVEDKPGHIALAKAALEREGMANKIEFFDSGDSVIQYLKANEDTPPDVIFIDLNLEGSKAQGDDVARYMLGNKSFGQTEICIMSAAYMSREKENEYAETNVKFFLKKPLITEQLEAVVRESKRLRKLIVVITDEQAAA